MFRVHSQQAFLRAFVISLGLSAGLFVCTAIAQDQRDQVSADKASTDKPAADASRQRHAQRGSGQGCPRRR